jgi:uncharacterized membrane protein
MAIKIEGDVLKLSNSHAGCMWVFSLFFIIPFTIGVFLLWGEPPEVAPRWQVIVFTGLVVIALPLLVHQLWRGTLIKVRINKRNGNIEINHRTFKAKWADHRHVSQLRKLRIEVSDNDGEFFSVYLVFADGEKLNVVHGNYRQGVMKECGELQAFLEEAGAKITRNEVKV